VKRTTTPRRYPCLNSNSTISRTLSLSTEQKIFDTKYLKKTNLKVSLAVQALNSNKAESPSQFTRKEFELFTNKSPAMTLLTFENLKALLITAKTYRKIAR
jgi:hypothetical protein